MFRCRPPRCLASSLLLLMLIACSAPASNEGDQAGNAELPQTGLALIELDINGQGLKAEVADTPASRQHGLMFRQELPPDQGMLFVYPQAFRLSFWMKNTPLPLDIAFIDRSGFIVDIQSMTPFSTDSHKSPVSVPYALEMHRGWFQAHEIEVGDRVLGLPAVITAE